MKVAKKRRWDLTNCLKETLVHRAKTFFRIIILHSRAMPPTIFSWELEKPGRKCWRRRTSLRNKMEDSKAKMKRWMSIKLTWIRTRQLNRLLVSSHRWLERPQVLMPSFTKLLGHLQGCNPKSRLHMASQGSRKFKWKTTTLVVKHLSTWIPIKIEPAQIPKRWELVIQLKRVCNKSDTVSPLKELLEDQTSPKSTSRTVSIQHRQANHFQMIQEPVTEKLENPAASKIANLQFFWDMIPKTELRKRGKLPRRPWPKEIWAALRI